MLFPLAEFSKEEVREIAEREKLPVFNKKESQDLCFVTKKDFQEFLRARTAGVDHGPVVDLKGNVLGRHRGIQFYTIGQRGGLGISSASALYVVEIDSQKNRITVGGREDLKSKGLIAGDLNILVEKWPAVVEAKIRYRKKAIQCRVVRKKGFLHVHFEDEQEAPRPVRQ